MSSPLGSLVLTPSPEDIDQEMLDVIGQTEPATPVADDISHSQNGNTCSQRGSPKETATEDDLQTRLVADKDSSANQTDARSSSLSVDSEQYPFWWDIMQHAVLTRGTSRSSQATVRLLQAFTAPAHWMDGIVGCATEDGSCIVTSPTEEYIPRPLLGTTVVSMMPDGHFGEADPIHHPQLLEEDCLFPWLSAIERPWVSAHERRQVIASSRGFMWLPLERDIDFALVNTSNVGLGLVSDELRRRLEGPIAMITEAVRDIEHSYGRIRELRWLYDTLMDAVDRLSFPATFRDMTRTWACVQRFWLYIRAWFDWNVIFMESYRMKSRAWGPTAFAKWNGCFTTSLTLAARLAEANIPVWIIRTLQQFSGRETIEEYTSFREPLNILPFRTSAQRDENAAVLTGTVRKYCVVGDQHLSWISREATRYLDKQALPVTPNVAFASTSLDPTRSGTTPGLPASSSSASSARSSTDLNSGESPIPVFNSGSSRYKPCACIYFVWMPILNSKLQTILRRMDIRNCS